MEGIPRRENRPRPARRIEIHGPILPSLADIYRQRRYGVFMSAKEDRIDVRMGVALREDIEALASDEGRSVADMTRRLLVEAIEARKPKPDSAARTSPKSPSEHSRST